MEPPCGQRRHGPAAWAEVKGRTRQEGTKTELGLPPEQTDGGFTQEGGVVVCRPSYSPFWDTQPGGVGQKLREEGRGLVWTFYRGTYHPVRSEVIMMCWSKLSKSSLVNVK